MVSRSLSISVEDPLLRRGAEEVLVVGAVRVGLLSPVPLHVLGWVGHVGGTRLQLWVRLLETECRQGCLAHQPLLLGNVASS